MFVHADDVDFNECSEELRQLFGVFNSKAELDRYATTSPFEALKKFFGINFNARPDADFMRRDQKIVDQRKRAFRV